MNKAPLVLFCLAAPLLAGDQPSPVAVTRENAFTFYGPFRRMTEQPHYVSQQLAVLCAMPGPQMIEQARRATGPHFRARVHIYASPAAESAIVSRQTAFPIGSVIVKEKLAADDKPEGVGGMIKRPAGYDPDNGDWEYFYSAADAGFSSGRLASCAGCHAGAKATDYVFGNWKRADWKPAR